MIVSTIAYACHVSTRTAERTIGSHAAADLAGISYRQLDYWARTGHIRPSGVTASGSGSRRSWTLADVQRIAAVAAVKAALGSAVEIEVALAIVDGRPLDRAVIGGRAVDVQISMRLDPVRKAVEAAWPFAANTAGDGTD